MKNDVTIDTVHTHTHTHGDIRENNKKNFKSTSKHNGSISFEKFLFSMLILIYHFAVDNKLQILSCGYIGVEFFFLVSGYLLAKKALSENSENKNIGIESCTYIFKRIKTLFPFALFPFMIILVYNIIIRGWGMGQICNSIWYLFFLNMSGIRCTGYLGNVWYVSAMLISMFVLYPMIRKYKKTFIYLIAPIIVIFVGGWISYKYMNLGGITIHTGIVYKALLRAFFEISLGCILYEISEKLKNINFTNISKCIFSFVEILGVISVFYIANKKGGKYDFIMLLILSIIVVIAFSEKTRFYNLFNNKFFYYLEKLSLPIYLNQYFILTIINKNTNFNCVQRLVIIIVVSILLAMFITYIIDYFSNNFSNVKRKVKSIFINEE